MINAGSLGGGAGAGNGGFYTAVTATNNAPFVSGADAVANTGSGGGGGGRQSAATNGPSGNGGSGIVIIRYPAYQVAAASTTGSPEMVIAGAWRVYTFVASGTITF
jgi:hypothetical protein